MIERMYELILPKNRIFRLAQRACLSLIYELIKIG